MVSLFNTIIIVENEEASSANRVQELISFTPSHSPWLKEKHSLLSEFPVVIHDKNCVQDKGFLCLLNFPCVIHDRNFVDDDVISHLYKQ